MKKTEDKSPKWAFSAISPLRLLKEAREAQYYSYSPYSHFTVGAALLLGNNEDIKGCNVENASYGMALCAERNVIAQMVALGKKDPQAIAIVGKIGTPCYPCGACLQVMWEFNPDMILVFEKENNKAETMLLRNLLPYPFSREGMKDE